MINIPSIQEYDGQQVILTSDRLVFVSKNNEHILLNSSGVIHMNSQLGIYLDIGVNDDTDQEKQFLVNAPKVQFGLDINGVAEPIVKGEQLDQILTQLMEAISLYADLVQAAAIVPGPLMSAMLTPANQMLKGKFQQIKLNLDNFKSNNSFTI